MANKAKSNLKTAGAAVAGGVFGGMASNMMNAGLAWGMSENGEESNALETLQFETETGTVTLEDADANGVYDAAVIDEAGTPAGTGAAPVSENTYDEMSFSEAFATARQEVGPGGVFAWNGNTYGTYYKEEWEGMDGEERENYWASVDQAEQENEYLASVHEESIEQSTDPAEEVPEAEIIETSAQGEVYGAEPVDMDLNNDGINESRMIDTNDDGIHDAIVSDTNNDGRPDLILADTDQDGEMDSYAMDSDHDGELDESGSIPADEGPYVAPDEGFGSDYDNDADVSDMV